MTGVSKRCIDIIKEFEGFRTKSYLDQANVWTIGYGSTGVGIGPNTTWTEKQCEDALITRLNGITGIVSHHVTPILSQGQMDALVSLIYNIGAGAFRTSTLLQKLNKRDLEGAAEEFLRWNKVRGVENKGLNRRREAERRLFLEE